jgi:hypothetical protein
MARHITPDSIVGLSNIDQRQFATWAIEIFNRREVGGFEMWSLARKKGELTQGKRRKRFRTAGDMLASL